MTPMLIRAIISAYLLGIIMLALAATSAALFDSRLKGKRAKALVRALYATPFWPLAIFSPEGRRKLLLTLDNYS